MEDTAPAFDVIVVGAGPAGCVLAARLSEGGARRVLLVEAGPDYGGDSAGWPADLLDPIQSQVDSHPWGYHNSVGGAGSGVHLPRARVVGGSSAINGCVWLRGSRLDYDGWAAAGARGWSFVEMLPYFQRAESDPEGAPGIHGLDGPVPVFRVSEEALSPVNRALISAASELGIARVDDLNGTEDQFPSVGRTPRNLLDGNRLNGALSYLAPARSRPNLTILPDTLVDRVLFEGRTARGVMTADGRTLMARDVILSGGSYASPTILMRSGIGPAGHLRDMQIPVVVDLPGVGAHLLDHPYLAPYTSTLTSFTIAPHAQPRRGSFVQTIVKARSRQVQEEIDLHIYPRETLGDDGHTWTMGFGISLQYARSRGRVRLTSPDPEATLDIDHNYFADPIDLEAMCDGLELLGELVATEPLRGALIPPERAPLRSRDHMAELIREQIGTTFHPSSTCRMGANDDPDAVVDSNARVRGVEGLRVCDASIFPSGPRCNLHWPVVAVAEKVADLMRTA